MCVGSSIQRGNTALHLACKHGLVDIVKILCGYNADTSIQNKKVLVKSASIDTLLNADSYGGLH